ncbi:MAG: hypothetical protein H7240_07540 [Glaciimonas sp.]|nr:hypothetical protein [Glaciimonas sp.]
MGSQSKEQAARLNQEQYAQQLVDFGVDEMALSEKLASAILQMHGPLH